MSGANPLRFRQVSWSLKQTSRQEYDQVYGSGSFIRNPPPGNHIIDFLDEYSKPLFAETVPGDRVDPACCRRYTPALNQQGNRHPASFSEATGQ